MSRLVKLPNGRRVILATRRVGGRTRASKRLALSVPLGSCKSAHRSSGAMYAQSNLGWVQAAIAAGTAIHSLVSSKTGRGERNAAQTPEGQQLLLQYKSVAGQVPGRELGLDTMRKIWQGAVAEGMFQTNGRAEPQWAADAVYGCPKCGGNTIADVVPKAIADGVLDPVRILDEYSIPTIRKTAKVPWAIPASPLERQIVIDAIDAKVASLKPDAPVTYGAVKASTPAPVASPSVPVTTAAPVPAQPVVPVTSAPQPAPLAPTVVAQLPAVIGPNTADQLSQQISSMLSQGASQNQALVSALQSLQSQGVAITPQIQSAVAEQVSASSGVPTWVWLAGGGTLLAVVLFMASRKRGR